MKKTALISAFLIFSSIFSYSVEVKQDSKIRFALWAEKDAFPGIETEKENPFSRPVASLKEIAPYLLSGMIYGMNFDYTPSDRARNVKEYFDFSLIHEFSDDEKKLVTYEKPWEQDNKIWCWVSYDRPEEYQKYFDGWKSIKNPRVMGRGFGKLSDGFSGIEEAFSDAIKTAVREYERKMIKNKPKAVTGKILLNNPPQIGVDAGRYVVTLDFFLQCDKIIEYTNF